MTEDAEDERVAKVSDLVDGLLKGAERDEVAAKVQSDEQWKRVHEDILETRKHLSDLRRTAPAPETFAKNVTETIHHRSGGGFFGRRTLGDRVPFGVLLIVAIAALAVVGYLMWSSQTGSLRIDHKQPAERPSVNAPTP